MSRIQVGDDHLVRSGHKLTGVDTVALLTLAENVSTLRTILHTVLWTESGAYDGYSATLVTSLVTFTGVVSIIRVIWFLYLNFQNVFYQ